MSILQALINGALGVTSSLTGPPIYKWVEAAAVMAATVAQVAVIASQKFAKGGIVSGPTLATVGEYAGARSNPEVITPLDKLKGMLGSETSGGQVTFRIEGDALVGVLNKFNRRQLSFS